MTPLITVFVFGVLVGWAARRKLVALSNKGYSCPTCGEGE